MGTANNITGRVEVCGASGIPNMGFKGEQFNGAWSCCSQLQPSRCHGSQLNVTNSG